MPIRWRLTLWFGVIILVVLVGGAFLLNGLLQHYLFTDVDNNLETFAQRVHGASHSNTEPPSFDTIHSSLPQINEFASPGIYIELVDSSGKAVLKSDNLGDQELPVNATLLNQGFNGIAAIGTVSAGSGVRVRVMVTPLYLQEQTLVLEVAQSLNLVDNTLRQLRLALFIGVLVALTLVGISGAVLVRRALSPVERITRTAQSIEAGADLSRRVNYKGSNDEITQLANTFDRMLARLDTAFASQKDFVADASHELRSPLTVIKGNLDLLKRNLSEEDRRECLRAIQAESDRMTEIVNDLLLLAEVESGQMEREEVALHEILTEGLARGQKLAGNRKLSIGRSEEVSIKGDAYRLRQLLWNLVNNAIKYTPEKGAVTLSLYRDDGWACLEVKDTGIGIPAEHLPYIFDRFYRVDKARSRASGGTGLGLSIAKGIAEQHGGNITVASEPGKGSTFVARLKL